MTVAKLQTAKEDLGEALELIEISRALFQKKLSALKAAISKEKSQEKIEKLAVKAEKVYQEYQKTLCAIESFMDLTYQKIQA